MDDLIFEMEQPNEIPSGSEWTEWWAIDETGLHLEYAPGYEPENQQTETCVDESIMTKNKDGALAIINSIKR